MKPNISYEQALDFFEYLERQVDRKCMPLEWHTPEYEKWSHLLDSVDAARYAFTSLNTEHEWNTGRNNIPSPEEDLER